VDHFIGRHISHLETRSDRDVGELDRSVPVGQETKGNNRYFEYDFR